MEDKERAERDEESFKLDLFIRAPEVYDSLYGEGAMEQAESESEFVHPADQEEVEEFLAMLREQEEAR